MILMQWGELGAPVALLPLRQGLYQNILPQIDFLKPIDIHHIDPETNRLTNPYMAAGWKPCRWTHSQGCTICLHLLPAYLYLETSDMLYPDILPKTDL